MAGHVLFVQRLFDEQQVERVQLGQLAGVAQGVGGVGVDLQQQVVTEALAHRPHRLHIPARLNLELDAEVALVQVPGHRVEQGVDRAHDPHRHSGINGVPHRAQVLGHRHAGGPQLRIEDRRFQRRLGHAMSLDREQSGRNSIGVDLIERKETGREMISHNRLSGVDVLRGVQRLAHGHALPPALAVRSDGTDQQHIRGRLGAEGRAERGDQR